MGFNISFGLYFMSDHSSILHYLTQTDLFGELPQTELLNLADKFRLKRFESREIIFHEGDHGDSAYLLISGRVSMLKSSPNGREVIVELIPPGDVFGIIVVMEDKPYPLTSRAQINSEALAFSRKMVLDLSEGNPDFQRKLISVLGHRLQNSHKLARALAHDRVEIRIASTLLALIPKFSSDKREDSPIEISISRQELAALTGTTLESASRAAKALEESGLIDISSLGKVRVSRLNELIHFSENTL